MTNQKERNKEAAAVWLGYSTQCSVKTVTARDKPVNTKTHLLKQAERDVTQFPLSTKPDAFRVRLLFHGSS